MELAVKMIALFFGFCAGSDSSYRPREFFYIDLPMSWANARLFCREHYTDLAGINSMDQIQRLKRPNMQTSEVWIGLSDLPESWNRDAGLGSDPVSWRWSETGELSQTTYSAWGALDPNNLFLEYCATVAQLGYWVDLPCSELRFSVCYDAVTQNYVLVDTLQSWSDSQAYCRTHYTDLATISSQAVNDEIVGILPPLTEAWMGLYRVPWSWSDEYDCTFRNWLPGQPDNFLGQNCVAEDAQHKWADFNCDEQRTFLCHKDFRSGFVQMKMKSTTNMTDSAFNLKVLQKLKLLLFGWGSTELELRWKLQPTGNEEALIKP